MKVLWFSNTPANADEYFNNESKGSGGWLKALDQLLQNKVELHIAFLKNHHETFKYKNTTYHPISIKRSLFHKVLTRFFGYSETNKIHKSCLRIIENVKPDVIHIHGTENPFIGIIQYSNKPIVVSIQGIITVISHKYLSGFERKHLNIKRRSALSLKDIFIPWSFKVQYELFSNLKKSESKNLQMVKHLIGRTSWDRSVASVLSPDSHYYHNDEILRNSFYKFSWAPHFRKNLIIHTTLSNDFYKGFETLCVALSILNNCGFNFEWQVAGLKNDDLIVKITKKKLKDDFPTKGLLLLGNLTQEKLIDSLLNADMYVMTSHIENSPNGLCEALLLGMPCISTFVGGVGSLINNAEDGILIQDGDPWTMAGSILDIAKNPDKAIEYGQRARERAIIRHDKTKIVSELIRIYSLVIDQAKQL